MTKNGLSGVPSIMGSTEGKEDSMFALKQRSPERSNYGSTKISNPFRSPHIGLSRPNPSIRRVLSVIL